MKVDSAGVISFHLQQLCFLLIFGETGSNLGFDAAVVASTEEFDVSVIPPIAIPRVGNQPVRSVVLHAPSQDSDGVTSKGFAMDVLVNSCRKQVISLNNHERV